MEVLVEHLGDVQFEARARGHKILCDQPANNGGYDEGMTPPELLLASLGTCAAFYAADYMRSRKLGGQAPTVRVVADKVKGPARLDNFRVEVCVAPDLSPADRAGIERAAHKCIIHNTLLSTPVIDLRVIALSAQLAS